MTAKNITATARELVEVMELYGDLVELEECAEPDGSELSDWAEIRVFGAGGEHVALPLAKLSDEQAQALSAAIAAAGVATLSRIRARLAELGYSAECDAGDPWREEYSDTAVQLRETFGLDDEDDDGVAA